MRVTIQCVLIIGIVFLIILTFSANHILFSQNSSQLSLSPLPLETIKIVNPITTQKVSTGQELIITGVSSDNALKNCAVSVIVNDVRPYQAAFAKGTDGKNDYSQWEFVLLTNYTQIIEGENKITSKLSCTSAPPRWYSVSVNGVPNYSNEEMLSPAQTEEQQNIPTTNLSETSDIDGTQTEEQQNIPTTNLSETSDIDGTQTEEEQNIPTTNLSETSDIDGTQTEEQQNIPTTNLSETSDIDGTQTEEEQNIPTTNLSETSDIDGTQTEEEQNIPTTNLSETSDIDGTQTEEQQNIPTTNLSETSDIDGTQTEEQQNIPTTNLSETSDIDGNNDVLLVSIFPLNNPVARGDSQNTTITVTDSASKPVPNAEIDGNLIYPGDNYEKEFSGITDSQGKFVYSWIIGENGDVGPLSIEVEVSSQGYPSVSATSSFEIVDSSEASGINNDSDDPFD